MICHLRRHAAQQVVIQALQKSLSLESPHSTKRLKAVAGAERLMLVTKLVECPPYQSQRPILGHAVATLEARLAQTKLQCWLKLLTLPMS